MNRYQGGSRAMEQPQSAGMIRFSRFVLDRDSGELLKDGTRIKLQDQPFQILCILLEQPGRVVTREELQNRIWPADTFVAFDQGLYSAVRRLRDALCDSAEAPRYIETLPRRGYRFIAPVETGETRGMRQVLGLEKSRERSQSTRKSQTWIPSLLKLVRLREARASLWRCLSLWPVY